VPSLLGLALNPSYPKENERSFRVTLQSCCSRAISDSHDAHSAAAPRLSTAPEKQGCEKYRGDLNELRSMATSLSATQRLSNLLQAAPNKLEGWPFGAMQLPAHFSSEAGVKPSRIWAS